MRNGRVADLAARRSAGAGAVVGAVAVPYTFQRTFMTRSNFDQALVTGLSYTITQGFVATIQESIQSMATVIASEPDEQGEAEAKRWSRVVIILDIAAMAIGMGIERGLPQRAGESLWRASVRTGGRLLATSGGGGAVVGAVQEVNGLTRGWKATAGTAAVTGLVAAQREWDRRRRESALEEQGVELSEISAPRTLAMGVGVSVGTSLLSRLERFIAGVVTRNASSVLPGLDVVWRPLGHASSLALLLSAGRAAAQFVFQRIEGAEFAVEPAIDVPPLHAEVSGGPGSLVDFRTLAKMGRRFVWTVRSPEIIERVTGEPAKAMPVRVFVGLKSAPSERERVDLAMAELERAGAFERSWLMVTTPTGTGYANYAAAGALELLSHGDCANVVMQYSARPSPISLDRVAEGRAQVRLLVQALKERLDSQAPDRRPTVVMFGESLGAWSSQDAFLDMGTQGLVDAGIDYAIWIGTPMESKWKEQVLTQNRPDTDRSLVGVFNDISEWEALPQRERDRIRYLMITHNNDGVAKFGAAMAVQRPDWLGAPDLRPAGVPKTQRFIPVTSFVQGLIDTKNAARVVPGRFEANGHDYRADLVPFFNALLRFGASPDRMAAIVRALETEESRRTRWIKERGKVGESMAAVILDKLREQDPEAFASAVRAVETDFLADETPE